MSINFVKIEQMDGPRVAVEIGFLTPSRRLLPICRDQHLILLHGKGRSLKDTSRVESNDRGDSQRPCEGLLRRSKSYLFLIIGSGRPGLSRGSVDHCCDHERKSIREVVTYPEYRTHSTWFDLMIRAGHLKSMAE